ncbi:murein hydrolase activator EnvC [Mesorhizobium sp. CAU 1741]|uniref:murein hydrolase activator EnvC family protein n=1 Tax=Mesorhizobium sp. CAU 1741 TaxID=3140366 RepID=UPI00325BF0AD
MTDKRDMAGRARAFLVTTAAAAMLMSSMAGGARAQDAAALEDRRAQQAQQYERITEALGLSEERVAEIAEEIAEIRKDHASLSAALVQAAKTERKLAQDASDIASRLDVLRLQESDLRGSLHERRGILAEVLGALQRMGLNPPPAILVRPEDALASVRSAILLAAVVPELRSETEVLIGDLRELARIAATIESQRKRLLATVAEQAEEKERLSLLLDEKQRLQAQSEQQLAIEQARSGELADQASSLRELIDALESEIEIAARRAEQPSSDMPPPSGNGPLLGESEPFAALLGALDLPVAGNVARGFGEDDDSGGVMQGDMVATHSAAIVTAPVDGSVLYAGPFRSYGQLLILNAGDGYHIVLAGMGRISVSPGQSVLAGEPVGLMGETRIASAVAFTEENTGPELYVEFRKDGKPVDPAPWWAGRSSGRTGNDT